MAWSGRQSHGENRPTWPSNLEKSTISAEIESGTGAGIEKNKLRLVYPKIIWYFWEKPLSRISRLCFHAKWVKRETWSFSKNWGLTISKLQTFAENRKNEKAGMIFNRNTESSHFWD
jgi:hypothetical protein